MNRVTTLIPLAIIATGSILLGIAAPGCNKTAAPEPEVADVTPKPPEPKAAAVAADKKTATPEALKAEIEALRDAKVAWRKVEWRTCLLDALKESAREKKPVFLWVLGGAPADGRC
jgi:hypothetical protein